MRSRTFDFCAQDFTVVWKKVPFGEIRPFSLSCAVYSSRYARTRFYILNALCIRPSWSLGPSVEENILPLLPNSSLSRCLPYSFSDRLVFRSLKRESKLEGVKSSSLSSLLLILLYTRPLSLSSLVVHCWRLLTWRGLSILLGQPEREREREHKKYRRRPAVERRT